MQRYRKALDLPFNYKFFDREKLVRQIEYHLPSKIRGNDQYCCTLINRVSQTLCRRYFYTQDELRGCLVDIICTSCDSITLSQADREAIIDIVSSAFMNLLFTDLSQNLIDYNGCKKT